MFTTELKKTAQMQKNNYHILKLDELYWFIGKKAKTETRENTYVMTMVSRSPRQIVGYDVAFDKWLVNPKLYRNYLARCKALN